MSLVYGAAVKERMARKPRRAAPAPAGLPEYADDVQRQRLLWMQAARGKRFCRIFPTEASRLKYAAGVRERG